MTTSGTGDPKAEEAAEWLARLNRRSVSSEELQEFYSWRREPGNAEAYDKVERIWRDSRGLGDDRDIAAAVLDALERPRRLGVAAFFWPLGRRQLAAVATLALLGVATTGLILGRPVEYETAVGEQRLVRLEDGSRLRLNTGTRVLVDYSRSRRDVELVGGEAFFDVEQDADRPFLVQAGPVEVRAIGTRFDIRRDGADVRVVLVHGSVSVRDEDAAAAPAVLSPGSALTLAGNGGLRIAAVDLESATSWTAGRMIFKETPLAEAIAEANRYSPRKIELHSPALKNLQVDGSFETGDIDGFVAALTTLFPLRSEPSPDGNVVLTAN
jgi:transmembrane sensor